MMQLQQKLSQFSAILRAGKQKGEQNQMSLG